MNSSVLSVSRFDIGNALLRWQPRLRALCLLEQCFDENGLALSWFNILLDEILCSSSIVTALSDIFRPFGSQFNNIILNQSLLRTTLLCVCASFVPEMAPKVGTLVDLL